MTLSQQEREALIALQKNVNRAIEFLLRNENPGERMKRLHELLEKRPRIDTAAVMNVLCLSRPAAIDKMRKIASDEPGKFRYHVVRNESPPRAYLYNLTHPANANLKFEDNDYRDLANKVAEYIVAEKIDEIPIGGAIKEAVGETGVNKVKIHQAFKTIYNAYGIKLKRPDRYPDSVKNIYGVDFEK